MKDRLNRLVKHREGFRPFAPIVPLEQAAEWFDFDGVSPESPHMLRVAPFKADKRALVPAVVHVDGTGRLQTLTRDENGVLYDLVQAFGARTGVPILLNTSFNVNGEPIIETPADALWCLLYTGVDCCVLGTHIVEKDRAYQSILDLYPRVDTAWISLITPTRDGVAVPAPQEFREPVRLPLDMPAPATQFEFRAREFGTTYAKYEIETQWGPVAYLTDSTLLSIVRRFDGHVTGRAVLAALLAAGARIDETWFVRLLGRLRRAGIIAVSQHPARTEATPEAAANLARAESVAVAQ